MKKFADYFLEGTEESEIRCCIFVVGVLIPLIIFLVTKSRIWIIILIVYSLVLVALIFYMIYYIIIYSSLFERRRINEKNK